VLIAFGVYWTFEFLRFLRERSHDEKRSVEMMREEMIGRMKSKKTTSTKP